MVTSSLSERRGAGPGRFKACWITAAPFIVSSTMVKMVVRTVALSSIGSALLVCLCCLQTVAYYSSHSLSAISTKRSYVPVHTCKTGSFDHVLSCPALAPYLKSNHELL